MEIPKFHQTFLPILKVLSKEETLHHREMSRKVIEGFYSKLSKDQLEKKTKSGDVLILNRIAWGKSYLKKGGFIEFPKRGYVRITDKGLKSIDKNLTLRDVENSEGFSIFIMKKLQLKIQPLTL
jgi:restriction system protein